MEVVSMRSILIVVVCFTFALSGVQAAFFHQVLPTEKEAIQKTLVDGGWLEQRDNITILHVSGSHYEMGYQHGYLLKDKVQENIRAFLHYAQEYLSISELLQLWAISEPFVPPQYIQEIQGIADGAEISFSEIIASIMAVEYSDHGCYGIAAWGPATSDGVLYHARSFDLPSNIQDPVSGRFAHENAILVVRNPEDGSASLSPSIAGSFHTGGGMNIHGVSLGIQICWSKDQTFAGNPYHFRVQEVLDTATTAEKAIQILNTNRTHGFNFIVSQSEPAEAFILEQTANYTYVGTHNNSIESTKPFWGIDHVVRRTNVFVDPTIAKTQRKPYNPAGLIGFFQLLFFQKSSPFFAVFQLYTSVSKHLYTSWGTLTLNGTMMALQNGYLAEDFPLLRLIERLGKGTGMAEAWNQWVVCGTTGDIVVSFATHDQMAYQTKSHYLNFYELLDADPD